MNHAVIEQLDKILALADSSHDGEAVVAVRKARQILTRGGLSFGDLVRAAQRPVKNHQVFSFLSGQQEQVEAQIHHMRQQLEDLTAQMQTQDLQLDFWRRRALDLEQAATTAQYESEKWKKLARDTAEKLWDLGHSIDKGEGADAASNSKKIA